MELRHLVSFCAIAEERHVTRAAARIGLAQPALTQQMRALEADLGVALLRRNGRGIELTPAGEQFALDARAVLEAADSARERAQAANAGVTGRLTLGMADAASLVQSVTDSLRAYVDRYPRVRVSITEGRSEALLDQVATGALDLAFVRSPVADADRLQTITMHREGFVVALPPDDPLAKGEDIELAQLGGRRLVLPRGRLMSGFADSGLAVTLQAQGVETAPTQETASYATAINLVAGGFGLTVAPASFAVGRTEGVAFRPLRSDPALYTEILLVRRRGSTPATSANLERLAKARATGADDALASDARDGGPAPKSPRRSR